MLIEIWIILYFLEYNGISTGVNIALFTLFCSILTSLTDFIVNMICYWKFSKYKNIEGLRTLLNQFLSGTVFSLVIDTIMIFGCRNFGYGEFTITQITTCSVLINLNIEYFLMYQCRIVILSQIQAYNS
jgi:hypothetical protein